MDSQAGASASTTTYNRGDFDTLPAEIRNEIFKLALTASSAILVKRHRRKPTGPTPPPKGYRLCGTVCIFQGKRVRRVSCARDTAIHLLRASKALHAETAPAFYYYNKFIFETPKAAPQFVRQINEMGIYLSDVEFPQTSYRWRSALLEALEALKISRELRRITIDIRYWGSSASLDAAVMWKVMRSFVTREAGEVKFPRALAALRSHLHSVHHNSHPVYAFAAATKEAQLRYLDAFAWLLPKGEVFWNYENDRWYTIKDEHERVSKFKALLVKFWEEEQY